jgi:hypothetical protein
VNERILSLEEAARVVNSNPDAPQLPARARTLTDAIPALATRAPGRAGS